MTDPYTHPIQPVQKTAESVHDLVERLAREAGLPVSLMTPQQLQPLEAFAQLVARECAQIAESKIDPEWPGDSLSEQAEWTASTIRGRFGIEE